MSHKTVSLPIAQAKAYLEGKRLRASRSKQGTVMATIYDYVFRTKIDASVDNMNYWTFVSTGNV